MAAQASTGGATRENIVQEAAAFNRSVSWFATAHTIAWPLNPTPRKRERERERQRKEERKKERKIERERERERREEKDPMRDREIEKERERERLPIDPFSSLDHQVVPPPTPIVTHGHIRFRMSGTLSTNKCTQIRT